MRLDIRDTLLFRSREGSRGESTLPRSLSHGRVAMSQSSAVCGLKAHRVPAYSCDVLTSRRSRYLLRRFEPWASAQRLMARLEIEVFPSEFHSTTCFQNHPISRNSLASGSVHKQPVIETSPPYRETIFLLQKIDCPDPQIQRLHGCRCSGYAG